MNEFAISLGNTISLAFTMTREILKAFIAQRKNMLNLNVNSQDGTIWHLFCLIITIIPWSNH